MERIKEKSAGKVFVRTVLGLCACLGIWVWNAQPVQAYESKDSSLWIGGTYMVRYGKLQITVVKGERGTATYSEKDNTLTLDNFKLAHNEPIAMGDMSGLKIVLKGTNELRAEGTGIRTWQEGSLTICGGILKISSGTKKEYGIAITTEGNLYIENCTLNAVSSSNPLACDKDLVIKDSTITLKRTGVDELNAPSAPEIYNKKYRFAGLNARSLTVSSSTLDITGINYALGTENKPVLDKDAVVTDGNGARLNLIKLRWPSVTTIYEYIYSKSAKDMIYAFDEAENRVIIKSIPAAPEKPAVPVKPSKPESPSSTDNGKTTKKYRSGSLYYTGKLASGKISCTGLADKKAASITIPAAVKINGYTCKVTSVGKKAFKNSSLKTVKIGSNATSIGQEAFYNCKKLKTLTLGKNVTAIGEKAFYKCSALKKVTLPSKTKTVKRAAFAGCSSLQAVKMGSGVTSIGTEAFSNCKKLTGLTLGKNVTTIGEKAFYKCSRLSKVVFKGRLKYIKKYAFAGCTRLKTVTFEGKSLRSVGSGAFKNTGNKIKVTVPKSRYNSYKKLLKGKGLKHPIYRKR